MAFRIPDRGNKSSSTTPKPKSGTVSHNAIYLVTSSDGRNIKKSHTGKSKLIINIPKGAKFYASKKNGNWVYGYAKTSGWINIRSKGVNHCKKV